MQPHRERKKKKTGEDMSTRLEAEKQLDKFSCISSPQNTKS